MARVRGHGIIYLDEACNNFVVAGLDTARFVMMVDFFFFFGSGGYLGVDDLQLN